MFTINRPLINGTTVIYENNKIGKIISLPKNDCATIKLFDDENTTLTIERKKIKATPHDIKSIIKYHGKCYLIKNIYFYNDILKYEICYANECNSTNIDAYDTNIEIIDKKEQEKLLPFLKFIETDNANSRYLNRKTSKRFTIIDDNNAYKYFENLIIKCGLTINNLYKISQTKKKTQNLDFQIHLIYKNPFKFLTEEVQLLSFKKAEFIAEIFELNIDFKTKCKAWTYYLFINSYKSYYIDEWDYNKDFKTFCVDHGESYENYYSFISSFTEKKKIEGKNYITTNYFITLEKKNTDSIINLYHDKQFEFSDDEIYIEISEFEIYRRRVLNNLGYNLEKEQKEAVLDAIKSAFTIITGQPGTGKTEIVKCILYVLNNLNKNNRSSSNEAYEEIDMMYKYIDAKNISLMAPTGLAFTNLQKNIESKYNNKEISGTCHKILYQICDNISSHENPENCNCGEVCVYKNIPKYFIIDEVSMLDSFLFDEVLKKCIEFKARLIMLGDVQQLPSIGPGNILKNIINSEYFNVNKLTKIKRQSVGCLVNNIMKMSKNEIIAQADFTDSTMELISSEEFIVDDKINSEKIREFIIQNNFNKHNTKFITAFNKETCKFNAPILNKILQDIFNPLNEGFEFDEIVNNNNNKNKNNYTYRVGDNIIRTENDYGEQFRANGEVAEIISYLCVRCGNICMCGDGKKITIKYSGPEDKPEEISIDVLYDEFIPNYAITTHKAQGSQYTNVIALIEPLNKFITKENLYTAISRAREKCIIISTDDDLISCQKRLTNKISLFMRISDTYELPDYSQDTRERYYIEILKDSKHIAKNHGCIYDNEKFAWYTYDNKIYELLKMVIPLLKKQKVYEQKDFIKKNGGFYRNETKMWYTYKSNEILKEFM